MGIPSFYAWLKKRYPLIKLRLEDQGREIPIVDNMYLDFNALIYRCVREQHHFLMNELHPRSLDEIYQRVCQYVQGLIDKVNPQKLLLIAFDGVVPRAKVNQSRERRFKATREKEAVKQLYRQLQIEDIENFKLNSISPGTQFLFNLCNKLRAFILAKMDSDWKHLDVIYSDCCTPGQGEQKILEFMRKGQEKGLFNQRTTHCVYSPDADLFLLMLSTRITSIYIIRQEFVWAKNQTEAHLRKQTETVFQVVFVNILREYLELEFQDIKDSIKDFDIHRVIDDFVLIMMFVGNDFLPKSFSYQIKEGHLTTLLMRYKQYLTEREDYINDKGKINWSNTEELLKIASEFEVKIIQQKLAKKSQHIKQKQNNGSDSDDDAFIKEFLVEDNKLTKGRNYYYQSRFKINPDDPQNAKQLEAIISKYLEGLEFYVTYYYLGCQSWSWFYPYHYTPLLVDVYEYIQSRKLTQVKLKQKGQPFDPFMALMFMLPEHSFGLLPPAVRETLMQTGCVLRGQKDNYPLQFTMDPFVPATDFEQKALIPFLDQKVVRQVYSEIPKEKYTKEELQRNTKRNPVIFNRVGQGNLQRTSGTQFNLERQNDVSQLLKSMIKPTTQTRQRFPSLKQYGTDVKVDKIGISIYVDHKYTPTNGEVVYFNHFQGIVEEVKNTDKDTSQAIGSQYGRIGLIGKCESYSRVKLLRLVRDTKGYRLVKTLREVIVPDFATFKTPDYDFLRRTYSVNPMTRLRPTDRVVILNKANFGDIGVIEGVEGDSYALRVMQKSHVLCEKLEENEQIFYTLRYVCQQVELSKQVLYTILDQIIVKTDKKQEYSQLLPEQWNLGLSLIDRRRGIVVPKYTRCQHQHEDPKNPLAIFDFLEISQSGLQLIQDYIEQMPEVVAAVKKELEKGARFLKGPLTFNKIVQKGQNIDIARLYFKLYKLEAKGRQYRIYSKISTQPPIWSAKQRQPGVLLVKPAYLLSKAQARQAPLPYLSRQPEYHMVGDRVVVTRTHQTGVVIGIDDNCMVVRFPKSSRSYKYHFTELFNQKWSDCLGKQQESVWNLEHSYYSPSYWTRALDFQSE